MSWVDNRRYYEKVAESIDPSIRLTTKDGLFWRLLAYVLYIITFGRISREKFLNHYATTLGPIQAYPRNYPVISVELIVHESQHTKQARRWFGFGIHPWIGLPFMAIAYVLLPLPIGLAFFRYLVELDADKARWRYMLRTGFVSGDDIRQRAAEFAEKISGVPYAWSLPRKWVAAGFSKAAEKVIAEEEV